MEKMMMRLKKEVWPSICMYARFPQIWLFTITILLSIFSLVLSAHLENQYWASICSNLFAGFVTGTVFFLLTGVRQIYIAKLEIRNAWLESLHLQILKFSEMMHKLQNWRNDDEKDLDDFVYDLLCEAHRVNEMIIYGRNDKRIGFDCVEYCKKHYGYNAIEKSERDDSVRDAIQGRFNYDKAEAIHLFRPLRHDLLELNGNVNSDIKTTEITLHTITRSVI